ncbi:multiple epidermal growth factor-like domains protein 11 [Crassostrea angulata]|uniref:multiple epidermal growth factor-like domains protein 11 n=1 Tax=Magallana angulata TaxID=2784310 RepID=UPI0022B0F700|nr:multiple epidermal growth factor-like domains protein 11 [Crassostrea angulata]
MYLPIDMLSMFLLIVVLAISQAYVNIALHKPAYQQYPFNHSDDRFDASNAVDGRKSDLSGGGGQCAVSEYGRQTATWWMDLTSIHSIHHITIYFRTDNSDDFFRGKIARNLLEFSVYVSNTTDRSKGMLCYKDDNFTINTIPSVFTTNCSVHGQYVIYHNERLPGVVYPDGYYSYVRNDLCEVEVYGCPETGFYGSNCSIPCPDVNCQYCHIETGTCQGCKPGYQGHHCELVCPLGSYGAACKLTCGHCRDVNQCDHVTGTCLTGCSAGYMGDLCKTLCPSGSYGATCKLTCGNCRDVNQCYHVTGTCLNGCSAGYMGNLCKTPCPSGFFGQTCSGICKDTCSGCNNVNGLCDSGCIPGWMGDLCNKVCPSGSYGAACKLTCGHCRDVNQCDHVTGTCLTGCSAGYMGGLCKTLCPSGSYGAACMLSCGNCRDVNQCDHVTGTCLTGCSAGYMENLCKTPCPFGFFGQTCSEICKDTCSGCNNVNGLCDSGCIPGWMGDLCNKGIADFKQ